MPGFVLFLQCVGKAVVKHGGKALARAVPFAEVIYEVAVDAFEDYRHEGGQAELRAALEGLAQAPAADVRQAAAQVVDEAVASQPIELQQALASYLGQVPAAIRRSLRRPSDPGGTTVPVGFSLQTPDDLSRLLPPALPRFQAGDRPLAADWELVELLGKGGFGEVWKARHLTRSRQKPVALKFCLDPVAASTLRNEAALHDLLDRVREQSAGLGIVPLLETYLSADPPCLMYELIEGGDLTALLQEHLTQGTLTPAFAAQTIHRLSATIGLAHRLKPPLVHRDLKPSNVLVRRNNGDAVSLFVADFGIGGLVASQLLQSQSCRGSTPHQVLPTAVRGAYTPLYASPQQVQGQPPAPQDDVHSLGVIWYQLVTGDLKLLSIPPDWREVVEERGLPGDQVQLLAACLASRPEKRPADAAELADRLADFLPISSNGQGPDNSPAPGPTARGEGGGQAHGEFGQGVDASGRQTREAAPKDCAKAPIIPVAESASLTERQDVSVAAPVEGPASSGENANEELEGTVTGESSMLLLSCTLLGGTAGAAAGWYLRGLLGSLAGGFVGWFVGFGGGMMLAYLKRRRRHRAMRLVTEGRKLRAAGKDAEALQRFHLALEDVPDSADALLRIAALLLRTKEAALQNSTQALEYARRACQVPGRREGSALRLLADIYKAMNQHDEARASLERALESHTGGAATLNSLAWLHATCPDPTVRDGARAVELANRACERTGWKQAHLLDTLAAAHAECGHFDEAVRWQLQALELAPEEKKADYDSRVRLYRLGQPFRVYAAADDE